MKALWFTCALVVLDGFNLIAQNSGSGLSPSAVQIFRSLPQDTPYTVVSRDANSRVWDRTTYEQDASSQWIPHHHSYTELATGLHYFKDGQWHDSEEEIDILPRGGARAVRGQHQVYFPANIYSGVIEIVTPDGERLKSRPLGISYFDGTNSVLIAELTNSIGQLISSNQIIYPNAFTGLEADLLATYRKGGLECDLVFRSQPPPPEAFGLDSSNGTRLELLTEFFDTQAPRLKATTASPGSGLHDSSLAFGSMTMVPGTAFQIPAQTGRQHAPRSERIPVSKTWARLEGRTFLIEELPYRSIESPLKSLPVWQAADASISTGSILHKISPLRLLPLPRLAVNREGISPVAHDASEPVKRIAMEAVKQKPGVVLDYNIINSTITNMTFQGDTTYVITGPVSLEGDTTIEGGTVIKYAQTNTSGCALTIYGDLACQTASYRPAIFTSMDDNSVGETIAGSTGNPVVDGQNYYLFIFNNLHADVHDLRMSYCYSGITKFTAPGADLRNIQFSHTAWPVGLMASTRNSSQCSLRNILMTDVTASAIEALDIDVDVEHLTVDGCAQFGYNDFQASLDLTNCLLVGIQNIGDLPCVTNHVVFAATNSGIFQGAGAGNCYLANGSPYRNWGTTNINADLIGELTKKTTYPPIIYSNVLVSTNITLGPQAPRDTNATAPDIGYHYDPIDYLVDYFWITNATLTVTGGAVLAGYNDQDVIISDGSAIVSVGTPLLPNWFIRYSCAQEQPIGLGSGGAIPSSADMINPYHATDSPSGFFKFTKFSCPAGGGFHLFDGQQFNFPYSDLVVQDCEFWSGQNNFSGYNDTVIALRNNLFARSTMTAVGGIFSNNVLSESNNLYWRTTTTVRSGQNSNHWFFFNNVFDNSSILTNNTAHQTVNGYNGYIGNANRLFPTSAYDIVTTNPFAYETGPLGTFYQPTNSVLIDMGSCSAGAAGLNFYATTTNEAPEANSTVDIGYHYLPPIQTMVVPWGDESGAEFAVPSNLTNAITIAAGYDHFSLALRADGGVTGWGTNNYGQTNIPISLTKVTAIAAGGDFAMALQNGVVTAWGKNDFGQTNVPSVLTNATAIAAGYDFGMAIDSGSVLVWGDNGFGQTNVPTLGPVAQIAAGFGHCVALLTNGTVTVWGLNGATFNWNITNVPPGLSNVTAIAAGLYHTLALKSDGTVVAWGAGKTNNQTLNNFGQSMVPPGLSNVVAIAAGGVSSLALQADGTIVAWGDNSFGQANAPIDLPGVEALGAGGFNGLAICSGTLTPLILDQPLNQVAMPGDAITFSVTAVGFDGLTFQWEFNGVPISGATNASFTIINPQATNVGSYQVVISDIAGSVTSSAATFSLLGPPQITSLNLPAGLNWITNGMPIGFNPVWYTLGVTATDNNPMRYPLSYQWSVDGTNVDGADGQSYGLLSLFNVYAWYLDVPLEGTYTVAISNAAGSTNITWQIRILVNGMVAAWGADQSGECDRPIALTNASALAAGEFHSVAVRDTGTVVQWGTNWASVPAGLTNAVAVAAGYSHTLALKSDGTVVSWGATNDAANFVPVGLSGVKAIAAGWNHNVALLTNGTLTAWGIDGAVFGWHLTEIPPDLTNVIAVAANSLHSVALRSNGTVEAWGYSPNGETNVPAGLSNVVAIAAGEQHNLALRGDGTVVAWGLNNAGQCTVPAGLSNVTAIAAGAKHSVALKNDGTIVAWGDNSKGQTNAPSTLGNIRLLAAGGDHTLVSMFSEIVEYPVEVTKDLLLVYNTNSVDSTTILNYYLQHRPMVSSANVLGIGCTNAELTSMADFSNNIAGPISSWMARNPTKKPSYIVMFPDIPTILDTGFPNVSSRIRYLLPGGSCVVSYINMYTTNDCVAYIDKIASFATNNSPGKVIISASAGGYADTNYYVDGLNNGYGTGEGAYVSNSLVSSGVSPAAIAAVDGTDYVTNHIMQATNVTSYFSFGAHSTLGGAFATNGFVQFHGQSDWFVMTCFESFGGRRNPSPFSGILDWFTAKTFGGTNYQYTAVAAVANTDECACTPDPQPLLTLWALGKNAGICCWQAGEFADPLGPTTWMEGDPLVTK